MAELFAVELAGVRLACSFEFPEIAPRFSATPLDPASDLGASVSIPAHHWRYFESKGIKECPEGEFAVICCHFSDALMDYDRMLFHGVAIRWQDKAYLITAPSGVGKSTQARYLQRLCPGAFSVICGDRPVLQFAPSLEVGPGEQQSVIVHPSFWNGKEGWCGAEAAPLAGIILLERGEKNAIFAVSPKEAAFFAFRQAFQSYSRPDVVRCAAKMVTKMLEQVPIWKLTTYEVPDSTKLLLETVFASPAHQNP